MTGTDPDDDGFYVWVDEGYYDGTLLADGRCRHLETHKYARRIHIEDVTPNCTPTTFVEVEQTEYIPVDEPWGYYLGLAEYEAGDTTSYRIDIDCEARPEVPTGPFHFTTFGTCGDSLTIALDGTDLATLPADTTCHPPNEWYRLEYCITGFHGSYDIPQGDYVLDLIGLPGGAVGCNNNLRICSTSHWIRIRYGKLMHLHLELRCPT